MAVLEILTYPNPILKQLSKPVAKLTPEIEQLAKDMLETMYDAPGVGLAAPQIGQNIRMVVLDTRPKDEDGILIEEEMSELEKKVGGPLVLINPEIISKEGVIKWEEGCLSVPSYTEVVERAEKIEVRAMDENGKTIQFWADGLLSVCIQHEIDHLDGKLFIERISLVKMNRIKSKIKKFGYPKDHGDDPEGGDHMRKK